MAPVTGEKCVITGKPAKYRDPVTGLPYFDLAAFKVIREQHTPATRKAIAEEEGKRVGEGEREQKRQRMEEAGKEARAGDSAEESTGVALSREKLCAINESAEVRSMLKDKRLQELVKMVDCAPDRMQALKEMRKDPIFEELMQRVLGAIKPDDS